MKTTLLCLVLVDLTAAIISCVARGGRITGLAVVLIASAWVTAQALRAYGAGRRQAGVPASSDSSSANNPPAQAARP